MYDCMAAVSTSLFDVVASDGIFPFMDAIPSDSNPSAVVSSALVGSADSLLTSAAVIPLLIAAHCSAV
jgi:hypothetical protein